MHADHFEWAVHGIFEFARDGAHDRRDPVWRNAARRRMEPVADDPHDEYQSAAGRKALDAGTIDCRRPITAFCMETNRSWSIDDKRYNFQFGCEIGWEIKDGKRVRMVKNPSYSGITTEFWNSLDAICSRDEWTLWGTPNCGKGQPQQVMGTGHGAAPSRFRGVKVGSAFKGS